MCSQAAQSAAWIGSAAVALIALAGCGGSGVQTAGVVSPGNYFAFCCEEADLPVEVGRFKLVVNEAISDKRNTLDITLESVGEGLELKRPTGGPVATGTSIELDEELVVCATSCDFDETLVSFRFETTDTELTIYQPLVSATIVNTCWSDPEPRDGPEARIVFSSDRDGDAQFDPEIYTVAEDGSDLEQLTNNDYADLDPAWSPDGTRIAFLSNKHARGTPAVEVYVIDADGSNAGRITYQSGGEVSVEDPSWSPDGKKIAYAVRGFGAAGIWVHDLETNDSYPITNELDDSHPSWTWSPQAQYQVAFQREGNLYLADDTILQNLPQDLLVRQTYDEAPNWTANGWEGLAFAFLSDRSLYVTADFTRLDPVVDQGGVLSPSWRPVMDGEPTYQIVFTRNGHLFVVNVATRELTPLDQQGADPDWGLAAPREGP